MLDLRSKEGHDFMISKNGDLSILPCYTNMFPYTKKKRCKTYNRKNMFFPILKKEDM